MSVPKLIVLLVLSVVPVSFFFLAFKGLVKGEVDVIHKKHTLLSFPMKSAPDFEKIRLQLQNRDRHATGARARMMGVIYLVIALIFSAIIGVVITSMLGT